MIHRIAEDLKRFAELIEREFSIYGLQPSALQIGVWFEALEDLNFPDIEAAFCRRYELTPFKLPCPDAIRDLVTGRIDSDPQA